MGGFSTAVPGPTNQGFAITPPDPYANLRALAMQGQIAEQKQNIATQQQAMGTTALNQQILQQQLDDQKALVQTFKDGVDPNKPDDIIQGIIKNGGSGPTAIKFVQEIANTRQINAKTEGDILANQKQREDQYRAAVEGITKLPPEQQQAEWNNHRQQILAVDPGAPALYPGNDLAMARANTHGLQSQLIDEELKKRETEKNIAQAGQAKAETEKLNIINQRLTQGAHVVQPGEPHPIDGIFPASLDPAQNQYFKAAYDTGANFINPSTGISELQEAVVRQASEAASKIREAQNPQIIAGKAKAAGAEAAARSPFETQTAVNTEAAKLRLQQQLSTDIFAGIGSPTDRARATAEYQKLGNDYIEKMESAQGLHDLISQAQGGNKAAPGLISIAELRTYLNRVNRTELQAIGTNAGNLLDKVQGVIGGLIEGQPVPPDIMRGVDQIATMQQQATQRKYDNQLGLLGTTYNKGQKPPAFQWQPHAGQQSQPAAGGNMPRVATPADVAKLPKGTHFLDPNGIERIRP